MLEKILDEKYFFITEKFYFEKKSMTFFLEKKISRKNILPTKKYFEQSRKIRQKIRKFHEKKQVFLSNYSCKKSEFFLGFFEIFFLRDFPDGRDNEAKS